MCKLIRELRSEKSLTQADLAHELHIAPSTVYTWESGKRLPSVVQLRHLAKFFDIPSDHILLVGLDIGRDEAKQHKSNG